MIVKSYIVVLLLIYFANINSGECQSLFALPPGFNTQVRYIYLDTVSEYLYASGPFSELLQTGEPRNRIAKWNGSSWDSLGSGVNDGGSIYSIISYNNNIVVGGSFDSIGGISSKGLAIWDSQNWQPFVEATVLGNGCVNSFFINSSNHLYIGGCFDTINGVSATGIAKFDGSNWYTFPPIVGGAYNISAIIEFNTELYIGGNFSNGIGKSDIMKFDGSTWVSVGGGLTGGNTWINDFEIYQGQLYVAGYFQTSNGDPGNNIAIWNGLNWSQPANGLLPSNVFSIHVFNNLLYAGGQINDASGLPVTFIAVWNGTSWNSFDNYILDNGVSSFASFGDNLYLAGGFMTINNDQFHQVAMYNIATSVNDLADCMTLNSVNNTNYFLSLNCDDFIQSVSIIDIQGRCLKHYENINSSILDLNLSNYQKGIYFVVSGNFKSTITKKIVIF